MRDAKFYDSDNVTLHDEQKQRDLGCIKCVLYSAVKLVEEAGD